MKSLMDKCCEQCQHTPATPCRDYIICRCEGPFCHDDADCKNKRQQILRRILSKAGSGRRKVVVCGGLNCGSAGASELADAFRSEIVKQGLG
ncbi:MAG: NADH-quinone oxidoreductase subunit F, partial [Firmicutes bacterium]|nr:NADH-quinone oxidoreductase subunit F [Bacillota bacterium]